jgi:hypothetical protein
MNRWQLNDVWPLSLTFDKIPPAPWSTAYWGPPVSMVMPTQTGSGGVFPAMNVFRRTYGFFGPKE